MNFVPLTLEDLRRGVDPDRLAALQSAIDVRPIIDLLTPLAYDPHYTPCWTRFTTNCEASALPGSDRVSPQSHDGRV